MSAVENVYMSPRGMLKLAQWLVYCQSIGWPLAAMDDLKKIWHQYMDSDGDMK